MSNTDASRDVEQMAARLRGDHFLAKKVAADLDPETVAKMVEAATRAHRAPLDIGDKTPPTLKQLCRLAVRQAVPFLGFGIFDNMVMITVGDGIDSTFGVTFGFSTLAAAGFGQMVSDSVGITLQGVIERFADLLRLPDPQLTADQYRMGICMTVTQAARTIGILVGCFIGMFPLLLLDTHHPRVVNELLRMLPAEKRYEFWAALETVTYNEGDTIIKYGSRGSYLYLVLHGSVEVVGRDADGEEVKACELDAGAIVGELEFIHDETCCADVVALTPVRTQRLSKQEFLRITGDTGLNMFAKNLMDTRYLYYRMRRSDGHADQSKSAD